MRAEDAMTQEEADYASHVGAAVRRAIDSSMRDSERSTYARKNMLGVSDIGSCREFVRRTILDEPYSDEQEDYHAAFVGTAVGDWVERALARKYPADIISGDLRVQVEVVVRLRVRGFGFDLPGHADIVTNNAVWDAKTVDGLGVVRRTGPTTRQKFQVTLYAKALIDAGQLPDDAWCALVFLDRSGSEPDPVVFAWRFDETILAEAVEWMDDVVYAIEQGEETVRDQPRSWCEACCPRYSACRLPDTDVEGLLEDPVIKNAVAVYRGALAAEKAARKEKESAKSVLANKAGVVVTDEGPFALRWVHVNPTDVPGHTRSGYDQIDLRPIKVPRRKVADDA